MFDQSNRFIIEDYSNKPTFASFLPGISGKMGIPIWCFYVNRGQGVTSFGVKDKEHAIMEFHAAQQAYQNVGTVGFRTFLKVDGAFYEPFYEEVMDPTVVKRHMFIGTNEVEIEEDATEVGVQTNVCYYTLPNEAVGGLVRKLTLTNKRSEAVTLEVLDGMPQVVPYGISLWTMKMMGQTAKAWMEVEDVAKHRPYYSVRASMEDSAVVTEVKGGHFYMTLNEEGTYLPPIVDTEVVFGQSTALTKPLGFMSTSVEALLEEKQICNNALPCGFFGSKVVLAPGESYTCYSLIGQVENKEELEKLCEHIKDGRYFQDKYQEAKGLTEEICEVIETKTASPVFDAYCKQTYLDNVLRGGMPLLMGEDNIYHVYSRKHGDIERDYNFFSMSPEFYSQGNANFRDVNQNRRCDVYFADFVKDYNIKTFYNLIQLDGYNPLGVQGVAYTLDTQAREALLNEVGDVPALRAQLEGTFTPGGVLKTLITEGITLKVTQEVLIERLMAVAKGEVQAVFGEGYWTDHWTYNLDLIESYLGIYPEKEKEVLFEDHTYTYFESGAIVRPRSERYVLTENGVRQYNAVDHHLKADVTHKAAREAYGKGNIYTSNLFEKLMIMATNKFAALDPYGMGIEMEGGKPGWYDALNGLPGIFGSSMAETYELSRMIDFMLHEVKTYTGIITLPREVIKWIKGIQETLVKYEAGQISELAYWDQMNTMKEAYRTETTWGIDGAKTSLQVNEVVGILEAWQQKVLRGIERAVSYGEGLCPTYFAYEVSQFEEIEGAIIPTQFDVVCMPYFLEGVVRYLKTPQGRQDASSIHERVQMSELYDRKLQMYKVNAPLKDTSFEVGRAKAFTPGWLENESIWLHMEYKYLLELLRSGLYEAYFDAMQHAMVPFLDAETYGRSILENASFIASSANPNEKIHGRGFVARLSGSTAEFLHMWQIMMMGETPFTMVDDVLTLQFQPALPAYLIGEEKTVSCKFLGDIKLNYHFNKQADIIPGKVNVERIDVTTRAGVTSHDTSVLTGALAEAVRNHQVAQLDVYMSVN